MIHGWRLSIGHLPKECPLPSPFLLYGGSLPTEKA